MLKQYSLLICVHVRYLGSRTSKCFWDFDGPQDIYKQPEIRQEWLKIYSWKWYICVFVVKAIWAMTVPLCLLCLDFYCVNSKRSKRPQITCLLCTCFMENPLKSCSIWCAGCFCDIVRASVILFGYPHTKGYYDNSWQGKCSKLAPYTAFIYFSIAEGIPLAAIPGSAWTCCPSFDLLMASVTSQCPLFLSMRQLLTLKWLPEQ